MMKKAILVIVVLCVLCVPCISSAAMNVDIQLQTTTNNISNEEVFDIVLNVNNIADLGNGINAYTGTLEFDPKVIEIVNVSSMDNWNTPIYNKDTLSEGYTKIVATNNEFTNSNSNLCKIEFKLKEKVNVEKTAIELKDFSVAVSVSSNIEKVTAKDSKMELSVNAVSNNSENSSSFNDGIVYILASVAILVIIIVVIFIIVKKKKRRESWLKKV